MKTSGLLTAVLSAATIASASWAQEAPRLAGSDVEPPARTKFVPPEYPPEALATGARGIVILEIVIDTEGRVESVEVIRSVAPFDEAAVTAARQWEYEVTRVDGRPVPVRLTVPITFALRLPELTRDPGIPKLRRGAAPAAPSGLGAGEAAARVTLAENGRVLEAVIVSGETAWAEVLLAALRSWQFEEVDEAGQSFLIEARFEPTQEEVARVRLRATDFRRPSPLADQQPATTEAAAVEQEVDEAQAPAAGDEDQGRSAEPPKADEAEAATSGSPRTDEAAPPEPVEEAGETAPAEPANRPDEAQEPSAAAVPAEPPIEVITSPIPTPSPTPTPLIRRGPGQSSVKGVTLGLGVPDLVSGRRPVVPPFARMARASGSVEVAFSLNSAGETKVLSTGGPELFTTAASEAVASWSFERLSASRLYLVAEFTYLGDEASASVALQDRPGESEPIG